MTISFGKEEPNMNRKALAIAASVAWLGGASPSSANLVTNGSFESGTGDAGLGGFTTVYAGDTNIGDWTVFGPGNSPSVDWINGYWQAQDGTHSIDMNGNTLGGVEQTIGTIAGRNYTMTFWMSGNPDIGSDTRTL
ncbi:MAG: DUF642 domain-containing protein, partial [Roseiarcus sp.]